MAIVPKKNYNCKLNAEMIEPTGMFPAKILEVLSKHNKSKDQGLESDWLKQI